MAFDWNGLVSGVIDLGTNVINSGIISGGSSGGGGWSTPPFNSNPVPVKEDSMTIAGLDPLVVIGGLALLFLISKK